MRSEKHIFLGYPFRLPEIKAVAERAIQGYATLTCADSELTDLQLLDKIQGMILDADLCLFDVTMHNVNVAVEFGLARGLGLSPLIMYCEDHQYAPQTDDRDVFSDLRGIDSLRYKTFEELESQLRERIPTLLQQYHKHQRGPLPRLQMALREERKARGVRWLKGEIFNSGDGAANRVKVSLAGYLLHPSVRSPDPVMIGTLVRGEPARTIAFGLDRFNMITYATGMEHVLAELSDDSGQRYEQRGRFYATEQPDGSYSFAFQGLGPLKAIDRFSFPTMGLENP